MLKITFIKSKDATQLKSSIDNTKLIIDTQAQLRMQAIALEIAMEQVFGDIIIRVV